MKIECTSSNLKSLNPNITLFHYIPHTIEKPSYKNTVILNMYYKNKFYKGRSGEHEKSGNYIFISHGYG